LLTIWLNYMVKLKYKSTEQKILDAAKHVFVTKGMSGARMQDIADAAGINKALLHYYFRSKEKLFETNWDVDYMYLSEKGKYRVVGINEDGRNKVLLFDHQSGKQLNFPEITEGNVQGVNISPSEKNMILFVASDKSPVNLWLYNLNPHYLR